MKRRSMFLLLMAVCSTLLLPPRLSAQPSAGTPSPAIPPQSATYCRFVPERSDDFAWENDMIAFRTYGPALAKGSEDSGIDCWGKRVTYPVLDKWYKLDQDKATSYHKDSGEGCDFYHTGKSRGCGGTALWIDGKMVLSGVYKEWKILQCEREKSSFQLTYLYNVGNRRIREVKTITIELGKRLFRSESVFTENDKPADLDIAIGITTHNQRGVCTLDKAHGWMAVWEVFGRQGFGTGVVMPPGAPIIDMLELKTDKRDQSHALLITHTNAEGKTVHYAGYGWSLAGTITTPEQWQVYLGNFATGLAGK